MTNQLAERPKQVLLNLEGVTLTENSLIITDHDSFVRAGNALATLDSCSQWFWSDYLQYGEDNGLKSVLDSARADLHRSTLHSYVQAGRFYPPSERVVGLSFSHHSAVLYVLGRSATLAEAKAYLLQAKEEGLTVGETRELIRNSKRSDECDPGPIRGIIRSTDFAKLSKWSAKLDVDDLSDDEKEEIRQSSAPLFEMLSKIHSPLFNL